MEMARDSVISKDGRRGRDNLACLLPFFPDFGKRSIVFILGLPHQGPTRGRILGHDLPDFISISTACQIIAMEKGTNLIFDLEARFCQLRQCEAYHQAAMRNMTAVSTYFLLFMGKNLVLSFYWLLSYCKIRRKKTISYA